MERFTTLGRLFFAVALIASGIQQLVNTSFVRLVPKLPAWIPWPGFWAGVVGVFLIVAGAAIAAQKGTRLAAVLLGVIFLLLLGLLYVPQILANPSTGFIWTNPCKVLALLAGTILLAGVPSGENAGGLPAKARPAGWMPALAPVFLGVFLLVCGVQHFVYAGFVDSLVPAWIPPRPRFWTCFTGVALIAGGAGLLLPKTARLAATLSGVMIFLWIILLHIPRAAADWHNAGETSAIFEALALSGIAFLVAGTRSQRRSEKAGGRN